MKKTWQPEELVEYWTLLPLELALLNQKNDENRLGFAILLKFFEIYARFPENSQEISFIVVDYVAKLLDIPPEKYSYYDWQGRSIKYHRAQIREFFGFQETKVSDAKELTNWLAEQALIYELKFEQLKLAAVARLRNLKLEPPTDSRLERIIRSAIRNFESKFFRDITSQLSNQSKKWIDDFLKEKASVQELDDTTPVNHDKQLNNPGDIQLSQQLDDTNNSEINTEVPILTWAELKTDPGRIGVESFQKEVAKLEIFEQLELPADLFKKIPTKVLQVYKSRVIVEHPRDLRRHPEHIRYTLFTAFCWLRSQEVIDNLVELLIQIVHRIGANAEKRVDKELIQDFKRVHGKNNLLYQMAEASLKTPDGTVKDVITEITRRWRMTSLLDILKETDLRVKFSQHFQSVSTREVLGDYTLQKRLLLCLYGLGTNTGLKRLSDEIKGDNYQDLLHVKRHFIQKEQLRNAIACVANAIFTARISTIWGEGTTACASDSKKFGAWDQNLMTEWHIRYGGRGVMIYWHVEKNSVCIYSQLKTCSSSEVAAMIEGLLRHCTEMKVETNYVDSHGQNEVAFAFCHLLGFQLMPRLKRINVQKLYRPSTGNNDAYPNLQPILTRAINWDLIRQQYDQMVKYATALRLGMAETEAILKRFTRGNLLHPTYQALAELGKVVKTIFLCKYLHSVELRQEINAGLNVVENWNSANSFIFYGKGGEIATNRLSDQELAVLSLHLLQISLVYINTLMIQEVLSQPQWIRLMKLEDLRALSPLIWGHVNPYGTFRLDLNVRLPIETG